ncbi:glycine betaine/L-proline ABC transporter substrate-binding protein ProX [Mesorhizobium sp. Cs1299R1N1]|uniref:glycine betaine/L-proline ABC transporter substrate-binding protein ProX n=1 Tax=Mesorhizobium sp. Cs1299R1N1 TaxID=3015172 RepID=UPI00301DE2AA
MKSLPKALLLCSFFISPAAFAGEQVIPAWSGAPEELMQTYIIDDGLKELGYEVADPSPLNIEVAYVAVKQGDATFFSAYADPLHNAFMKENGGIDVITPLGPYAKDGIQGYLIDKKTADATGIKYLEDLKDPEKAKLFDIDGNGKADLFGCDPGWGCERVINHHLDAYGLRDTVEQKQGNYTAIITDAIQRIKEGKPTIYYTWTPYWLSSVLQPGRDVVWLNVKKTELPDGGTGNTEIEGVGNVGFTKVDLGIAASTKFINANPSAKKFFKAVKIPLEDLNMEALRIHDGEKANEQIRVHASEWIAKNKAKWDEWIAEAKAAK